MKFFPDYKITIPLIAFLFAFMLIPLPRLDMLAMMPGDIGDSRLLNYILENTYQVMVGGSSSLWHLSFFFPFPYVLGFSDNLFGSAPVYVLARVFNANADTAYQIWFLFGYAANFGAAYYALRRLNSSVIAATVGALIFAFALPTAAHAGHAQLHYRFGLPLAIVFFAGFLVNKSWRCLLVSGAWLVWQFYAGVYIGFFTLLLLATMSLTFLGYARVRGWIFLKKAFNDFDQSWRLQTKKQKLIFLSCLALLFVLLLLLFYPYLQVTHLYGAKRPWAEIASMLPRPQSYFLSDASAWWSFRDAEIFSGIPMRHEHQMFIGLFPLMLAMAGLIVGSKEKNGLNYILITGMLVITIVITLHVGGVSLWYFLHQLPLASAIRAMTRLDQAFLFPVAYLAAISVDKLKLKFQWGGKAVFVLILPLLITEASMTSMSVSSKESWRLRSSVLEAVVPENLSDNSILFFAQRSGPPYADELDAMWASLRNGKKTMNGYSGLFPPDYDYEFGGDCSQIPRRVLSYLRFSNQSDDVIAYREFISRIVPMGFHNCDVDWLTNPPSISKIDRVYKPEEFQAISLNTGSIENIGSQLLIRFTINNASKTPFAATSSLGKPIRISWRYIDNEGRPLGGWNVRKSLPFDIPASGEIQISFPLNVSEVRDAKGLEISLVQELVFWGHDIGVKPLTMFF